MLNVKTSLLFLSLMTLAISANAETNFNRGWISGGGAVDGGTSMSLGGRGENFGAEVGLVFNSEYSSNDILDYPVPHNSYVNLGKKRVGNTYGIDLLAFHNFNEDLSAYIGLGGYFGEERDIARSTATGWLYTQQKDSKFEAAGSVGLQYIGAEKFTFGVGYHSIRGPNAQIGFKF